MDSSTKKSGKSRTSKKGSRAKRNTPVKTLNHGNFLSQKAIPSDLLTDAGRWSLSINGSLSGITRSLPALLLSIQNSSFKQREMGICKLSMVGCEGSLTREDNTTKSSLSQGNPHCLMCLYEMLSSRLEKASRELSERDQEYFSLSMTQLSAIYRGLLSRLTWQGMPVSSLAQPCPHQSPK